MRKNRFISLVLALAMALSTMSGLSSATVFAEDMAYTDWDFAEPVYTEGFENITSSDLGANVVSGTVCQWNDWTFSRVASDAHVFIRAGKGIDGSQTLAANYTGTATYSKVADSEVYYYKYNICT